MRKFSAEEQAWMDRFDDKWKHDQSVTTEYDTMSQTWVDFEFLDEEGEHECFSDRMDEVMAAGARTEPDARAERAMKPRDCKFDKARLADRPGLQGVTRGSQLTPSDYYCLPSLWYSHNYCDKIIDVIDKEAKEKRPAIRGCGGYTPEVKEFPAYPGIIKRGAFYKVTSFFEGEKYDLGVFTSFSRAKDALITFNREVATRGCGVDY